MEKIVMPSTSIMIMEACTLKCKLCLYMYHIIKKYVRMTLDETRTVLGRYFKIVDSVEKLSVTGGEPLLNLELNEILQEILSYEQRITKEIILIANGTLQIQEKALEVLGRSAKVKVIVNNYGTIST